MRNSRQRKLKVSDLAFDWILFVMIVTVVSVGCLIASITESPILPAGGPLYGSGEITLSSFYINGFYIAVVNPDSGESVIISKGDKVVLRIIKDKENPK